MSGVEKTPTAQATPEAVVDQKKEAVEPAKTAAEADPAKAEPAKTPEAAAPDASKKADAKDPEGKPAVVPEKYDLKVPDGSVLDAAAVDEIAAFAKARKLSQEDAQELLNRESATRKADREREREAFAKSQKELFEAERAEWKKSFVADPEFGGDNANESAQLAKAVTEKFFDADTQKILNDTGFGDFPGLAKALVRMGKALGMAQDKLVVPGAQSGGTQPIEDVFYPSMKKTTEGE